MNQDQRLGELLVEAGKLAPGTLAELLREQKRAKAGGRPVPRLGELLLRRGLLSSADIHELLERQTKIIALCAGCGTRYNVVGFDPGKRYACKKCRQPLRRDPGPDVGVSDTRLVPSVTSAVPAELEPKIEAALRDPKRRLGKFLLVDELGRGGMGVVYRAWQEDLHRVVALKVLSTVDDPEAKERFLREARVNSRLHHPNLVAVHEFGEEGDRAYFTMDFVEGASLDHVLRPRRPPVSYILELIRKVALALHHAHEQGVVHRDIKPQNILVAEDGSPYLSDFGLAVEVESDRRLTVSGTILGTPAYMSPEQAAGRSRQVDSRSDLFSLGVVLYEGLTGTQPFRGKNVYETLEAIQTKDPEPPSSRSPGIPKDVETICLKCLQKDPDRRYPTAKALARDLERYLEGEPIQARATGTGERASRWVRRNALAVGAALAAVPVLVLIVVLLMRGRGLEEDLERLRERLAQATDPAERERIQREIDRIERGESPRSEPEKKMTTESEPKTVSKPDPEPEAKPRVDPPKATDAWKDLAREADRLRGAQNYGEALARLNSYRPANALEQDLRDRAAESVRNDLRKAFEDLRKRAEALADEGKLDEAIRTYGAALQWNVDEVSETVGERTREIEKAREAKAAAARAEASAALRSEVVALAGRRRYDEAAASAGETSDLASHVRAAASVWRALPAGAAAMKGKTIETTGGKAEIRGGDARTIELFVVEYQAIIGVPWTDLKAGQIEQIARAGGAGPEALGLFRLFEGDLPAARAAWASSDRKGELDALAALVETDLLEAEARASLEALFAAAEKKKWSECEKILSLRGRLGVTRAWTEAEERIGEVERAAAGTANDARLFAQPPRAAGREYLWSYDFARAESAADWRLSAMDVWEGRDGLSLRIRDGRLHVRNSGARFLASLEGDASVSADVIVERPAGRRFSISLGGYRWFVMLNERTEVKSPTGKTVFEQKLPFAILAGTTLKLGMSFDKGVLRLQENGEQVAEIPISEPVRSEPPQLEGWGDMDLYWDNVQIRGKLAAGWETAEQADRDAFAQVRRQDRGTPEVITDGSGIGSLRPEGKGIWEVAEGALRMNASDYSQYCQFHGFDKRSQRLRFEYRPHRGAHFETKVRSGDWSFAFFLPMDGDGAWREVEIFAAGGRAWCRAGGQAVHPRSRTLQPDGLGMLRFYVRAGSVSLKNVVLEELRNASDPGAWSVLFGWGEDRGISRGGAWEVKDKRLVGSGDAASGAPVEEASLRLWTDPGTRVSAGLRGELVFGPDDLPLGDGKPHWVRLRAEGNKVTMTLDGAETGISKTVKTGSGPLRLRVEGGTATIESIWRRSPR